MPINPANATELATIAREVGAEVVEGDLRYETGSWQLGDIDLGEHLDRYRDQRLMLVFVSLGDIGWCALHIQTMTWKSSYDRHNACTYW